MAGWTLKDIVVVVREPRCYNWKGMWLGNLMAKNCSDGCSVALFALSCVSSFCCLLPMYPSVLMLVKTAACLYLGCGVSDVFPPLPVYSPPPRFDVVGERATWSRNGQVLLVKTARCVSCSCLVFFVLLLLLPPPPPSAPPPLSVSLWCS